MTELSPITPPPEFIEEWIELSRPQKDRSPNPNVLATYAARWGADQELDACCEWLESQIGAIDPNDFRAARRPKPPSLKDQALAIVENLGICDHLSPENERIICLALESIPD